MAFSVVLNVGQSTTVSITPLEADGVTVTPGAVVSAQTYSLVDAGLSVVTNADGTATITALGGTTVTPVTGTGSATVTDADSTSGSFTGTFEVTVIVPIPHTASIGFNFSTPTP